MVGSLGYMSIKSHEGKQTGIPDDLESFTYTIISLIAGNLPWMKIHVQTPADIKRVRSMKETSLGKKWFQNHNVPL